MKKQHEQWRPIPGFNDYEASSLGKIKRVTRGRSTQIGRILSPKAVRGYLRVNLYRNDKPVQVAVHRMIYSAFHPEAKLIPSLHVHHIDGNPLNNSLKNLKKVQRSKHPRSSRKGMKYASGLTPEMVSHIRGMHSLGCFTISRLASIYNVNYDRMSSLINRKTYRNVD